MSKISWYSVLWTIFVLVATILEINNNWGMPTWVYYGQFFIAGGWFVMIFRKNWENKL